MIDYRHPKRPLISIRLNKGDEITLTTRPVVTRSAQYRRVEVRWTPRNPA